MLRKRFWAGGSVCLMLLGAAVGCNRAIGTTEPARFVGVPEGHVEATAYLPEGDPLDSVLIMRATGPEEIRTGEEFEYKIELYNPTQQVVIKHLVVSDYLPPEFELVSSTPRWNDLNRLEGEDPLRRELRGSDMNDLDDARKAEPAMLKGRYVTCPSPLEADRVQWFIEELYPQKLVTIRVRGRAGSEGYWKSCATASYDLGACMAAKVVSPELKLTANLERDFILCETDQTDLTLRVSNVGSGQTEDVTVTAQLPDGLTYNGKNTITEHVGEIASGKTKTITKSLRVAGPGQYVVRATAKSRTGLSTNAGAVTLTAREATLDIRTEGPREEYVGLPVEYTIHVTNTGDAPARNVVIESEVSNGASFVDATHDGQLEGDTVTWHLDRLAMGESVELDVRFEGQDKGYIRNVASARSECAADVTAIARTELEGVASMVVEVVDTEDPIRVGGHEEYQIKVHNQGSAPETDVMVACALPAGQQFVSASGTTDARTRAGASEVVFEPVESLESDETATWKVRVRGTETGDMRFRVAVDSDQHGRPVRESEATRVFE